MPEMGVRFPAAGGTGDYKLLCGFQETNMDALEDKEKVWTEETYLSPLWGYFKC